MTEKAYVTIWHGGKSCVLPLISSRLSYVIDKNGMKQKGFFDSSRAVIRVPCGAEISIGDFVRLGKHTGDVKRGSDLKVMEIYDNSRGITPHYRLVCER